MRNPNCECFVCKKPIYRRPKELEIYNHVYCSQKCYGLAVRKRRKCAICKTEFKPEKPSSRFCSRSCANQGRKGIKYSKGSKFVNKTQRRLRLLMEQFTFGCCMVEGCCYNRVYHIHRLIPGKEGGKYEIGNMYAICPNHHAEVHAGLIILEMIDNCTLRAIEIGNEAKLE